MLTPCHTHAYNIHTVVSFIYEPLNFITLQGGTYNV